MAVASRRLLLASIVLLAVALPPSPIAAARSAVQTLARQFPVARAGRLTIQNSRGDIIVQGWARPIVQVKAVTRADNDVELNAVPVKIVANEYLVAISSQVAAGAPPPRARVDYELRVPADFDLKLVETARGRVEITGVAGRAIVHVENGPVRIAGFSGRLDAMTTNGDIDATLVRADAADPVKLETFNGDIRLRVPPSLMPHVQARTLNGKITSDLSLKIEDPFGPQVAHDPGGTGAPFINLVAVTGDIKVLRR